MPGGSRDKKAGQLRSSNIVNVPDHTMGWKRLPPRLIFCG
jgi:hypothetical protein